jgi:hypothetical protein
MGEKKMPVSYEGKIEIPLEEFWEWVSGRTPVDGHEVVYGVPQVNSHNNTMEVSFAASNDCPPSNWAQKPKAIKEWEELERGQDERNR